MGNKRSSEKEETKEEEKEKQAADARCDAGTLTSRSIARRCHRDTEKFLAAARFSLFYRMMRRSKSLVTRRY